MPYCRNCGKEIDDSAIYCTVCQDHIEQSANQQQPIVVQNSNAIGELVQVIVFLAIVIGVVYFVAAVQIFNCPSCNNDVWVRWACGYCGQDGQVTLWDLIRYSLR